VAALNKRSAFGQFLSASAVKAGQKVSVTSCNLPLHRHVLRHSAGSMVNTNTFLLRNLL